jgi:AraC family transcriptional regulator of adaptative response/methylated-DNA-[protein]-cysteine methyltransferase
MLVTDKKKIDTYYQALVSRESNYVGIFYVGVKTTSVFCIATCRARKPKLENVEFYTNFKDALASGYRPCKICKPTENASEAPADVAAAIELVRKNPKQKISDYSLKQVGVSPEATRRWFQKHYGMTFQAFQRMYRINNAFQELKNGKKISAIAFETGYESLSGFGYTYKKFIGGSPKKSENETTILISRLTSPLGPMFICATETGVCLLEFVDRRMLETELKDLQRLLKAQVLAGENQHTDQAKQELAEYFDGKRKVFHVSLHTPGTQFQNEVWTALLKIPCGKTTTYHELAKKIARPHAMRAVGAANGANRISIIVPCHRVIGKDGSLTGYGGGLERKQWLLDHEKAA